MTAIAVGVMVNLDGDVKLVDRVEDDGKGRDPYWEIELLWESVKGDWPGYELLLHGNEEADELLGDRRCWQYGITTEDNKMAARIEEHNAEVEATK